MIIKKGNHRAEGFGFGVTTSNEQSALVTFTDSCRYDIGDDQADWNKLFGRSTNGFSHHANSMRVGWRYNPERDQIELGAYTYKKGQRQTEVHINPKTGKHFETHLGYMDIGQEVFVSCKHVKYKYVFEFGDGIEGNPLVSLRLPAKRCILPIMSMKLNPYFGGNRPAPHDIEIALEFINR